MKRFPMLLLLVLLATPALAAGPFYLDRGGNLWKAEGTSDGLVLTGEREGEVFARSLVPFPVGMPGTSDTNIQVLADNLTERVIVIWQRNWSDAASEILAAVWAQNRWEKVIHLGEDLSLNPRSPAARLTEVASVLPLGTDTITIRDSFLHILWWEGTDRQHGMYALLRLNVKPDDANDVLIRDLDSFIGVGMPCLNQVPPAEVLEHPLFATQVAQDRALAFFGSHQTCLFQLLEISFKIEELPEIRDIDTTTIAGRRRHVPVFGVRRVFDVPTAMSLQNARVILGPNLTPVAYRVQGTTLEYVIANETTWSARRTLVVKDGLTLDQAIPLLEDLAR